MRTRSRIFVWTRGMRAKKQRSRRADSRRTFGPGGEEKEPIERDPSFKPRRWVVELAHSWFNRFRKLVPRYEKTDLSHNALCVLAAAMIVLNKVVVIYR